MPESRTLAYSVLTAENTCSLPHTRNESAARMSEFRNILGMFLQLAGLTFLPFLILWQLNFGFNLLWMPSMTLLGVAVFLIGHKLRDRAP